MSKKPSYDALERKVRQLEDHVRQLKQAIADQQENNLLFRELTTLSPGGVYRTDANGDCIYTNPSWLKMAGVTFEEASGKGWLNCIHPEDRQTIEAAWDKMVASRGRWGHEYRFLSADGKTTWVSGLATPIIDSGMNVTGYLGLNIDITARKKAEETACDTDERMQTLFQSSPVALWEEDFSELDAHLKVLKDSGVSDLRAYFEAHPDAIQKCSQMVKVVDVNQAALQLHGAKSKAELLGNLGKIFTERSLEVFKEEVLALAEGRTEFKTEGEVRTLDGEKKYIYLNLLLEKEPQDSNRVLLATMDITQRKRMEEALRESEARFKAFLRNSPIGVGLLDAQFRYLYINDKLQKINGPSIEEHLGTPIAEVLPKSAHVFMPLLEKVLSTGEPELGLELSGEIPSSPGQIRHFLVSYFPVPGGDGEQPYIGIVVVDVTDRKKAEEALRNSEEKYRELIELAQEGIWALDKEDNTRFVNPSMAKMLGYTPEEMLAKPLYSFMDAQGIELAKTNIARRRQGIAEQHDFEFVRKDGQRISTTLVTTPLLDGEGNYTGAIAGIIDITEKRRDEEERRKLQAHLAQAQKMESIGTLAGGIAHDFNNILTSIIGFTELSFDDVDKDSIMADNLQEIYTASLRAKELVKQILAFARQSEGDFKPIQVNFIIREVLKLMRSTIPANIEIKRYIDSNALIMGNAAQVHQVLMNLCSNAAQAMAHDGGILNVALKDVVVDRELRWGTHLLGPGNYIEILVSDTGPGIAAEIINHIFEPYYTTKGPGEGTGMGLAMVNGIVESYGGKIAVASEPGQGAQFSICLPVTGDRQISSPYQSEALPRGDERILFVDDEAPIARMNGMVLDRLGYAVTTRTSSRDALELFRSKPDDFDLVISDMTMPEMTGDALAGALLRIRPEIPIILCTGYSKRISEESARQFGIKAFLHKPIVKADIATIVRKILDAAKA